MRIAALPLALAVAACATPQPALRSTPAEALTFVHDDFPAALARARAQDLPLFVEAWADW